MHVLLIGSGGREHAIAWSLAASPLLTKLYVAPGNAGIGQLGECVAIDVSDHGAVIAFCRSYRIDFVVVGPEAPLVAGIVDDLTAAGFKVFGPSKAAARLEGSKRFTKDLCVELAIPTGSHRHFRDAASAKAYVATQQLPVVVKADGLAAGKGVVVAPTRAEAEAAIDACIAGAFGDAGEQVLIEEFLDGEEVSFFALVDGVNALALASAQDHKRAGDGDTGPNTGGMGAYSPPPVMTPQMVRRTMNEIIMPTIAGMAAHGTPFKGVLFAGLMICKDGPKLVEYNVRFGDPECQVLMLRLKSDLLPALIAAADGVLKTFDLRWHEDAALTVVMAATGYPGPYVRGGEIKGLKAAAHLEGVEIFHAGTMRVGDQIVANGGRVLSVTALGTTIGAAQQRAYEAIRLIDWPGSFWRTDIGWRAIERERANS
jgi:phosphoribosylamine--glycine ligase